MTVYADEVAGFISSPADLGLIDKAEQAIPIITTMVRAYVRGGEGWTPNPELEAVIFTAACRLTANPSGIQIDQTAGPFSQSVRGAFGGWTPTELAVLNRYRRRAV